MSNNKDVGIVFDVETSRILEILSKEIYDSPYAMLRENVQNGYDAILMRRSIDAKSADTAAIEITIDQNKVVITDTGIGMTEEILRNNFWRAGSSGKKTELASKSGVIGTFGIGAMANFGVCSELRVETRFVDSDVTFISSAKRDELSIARECVTLERIRDDRPPGTKIFAVLDKEYAMDESSAIGYLTPYVSFLPIPVRVNGKTISGRSVESGIGPFEALDNMTFSQDVEVAPFNLNMAVSLDRNARVKIRLQNLSMNGDPILGELLAVQDGGQLMGYRNYFGLAPAPVSSHYQFGGLANLSILTPTAGREALSRESIQAVNALISRIEAIVTEVVSTTDAADRNAHFLQHLVSLGRYDWARKVKIDVYPNKESVPLGKVGDRSKSKKTYFYTGKNDQTIQTYSSHESDLLLVSQANPRRNVQMGYIKNHLSIEMVPDKPRLTRKYKESELSIEEAALLIRVSATLAEDYLMPNSRVHFADISHGVEVFVEKEREEIVIYLARASAIVRPVLGCYKTAFEVFGGFVKDFVRVKLYPHISSFVPSATKGGAEALRMTLQKNRELYRYDEDELGVIETLLSDLLSGDRSLAEVITSARKAGRAQTQKVSQAQVGLIEETLPSVVSSPTSPDGEDVEGNEFEPAPAILRKEIDTDMKILQARKKYPQLNGFDMFLGLSDRLFRREQDFFHFPHTTKLIWASHRIIFIFTHASGNLTLYYDVELKDPLKDTTTGGDMVPTTTLITKKRIFVPVIPQLKNAFEVVAGVKEFLVSYDVILS